MSTRQTPGSAPVLVGLVAVVAAGMALAAPAPPAAEAQQLLERHIAWRGGRQALAALTFLERRGDVRLGDNAGTLRAVGTRDGHLRYDIRLEGVQQVEALTPHGGWRWLNGEISDLPDDRLAALRSSLDEMFARHLLGGEGSRIEHLGSESREGATFEVLRLTDAARSLDLLIDGDDGSLHWTREPDDGAAWTRLQDWRLVAGVRFAFRAERRPDDPNQRQLTEWREIIPAGSADPDEFRRPPERTGTLAFDDGAAEAPFDLYLDSYIELPGQVVGHDVRIMLDSGAGITVLARSLAQRIGLSLRDAGTIQGIGGEERLYLAEGVSVAIAGVTLRDVTVAVLDLSEIAAKMGRAFEVILGIELFTRAVVTVDYPARRLTVRPPHAYRPPAGARTVRMLSRDGVPVIACRFEELPESRCDIDTGSNGTVDIVAHYVREHELLADRPAVSRIATGGVGGILEVPVSTLRSFSFAGVPVGPMPANFMDDAVGSLDTDEIAGNIGAAVLRQHVLVFDYPGMRLHVIPPADPEPVRRDRSGLQSVFQGDHLEVFFVAPGSPAEAAGLSPGQRIVAIDGRAIDAGYLEGGFRWTSGAAGTEVVLSDEAGRDYRLVLADYF